MADSVVMVSHLGTNNPETDSITNEPIRIDLVKNNKPNYGIIKQTIKLNLVEIDALAQILITPNTDSTFENIHCFIPHHGILIFWKNYCSYFDICFSCRHFTTSDDIQISDMLSDKTWNELKYFFKRRGLVYKIERHEIFEDETN